jgi:hypothetical protein
MLFSIWNGKKGWYCVIMPVTRWAANVDGRRLGFPKYVADSITLEEQYKIWLAQYVHQGKIIIQMQFQSGINHELSQWELELITKKSFFPEEPNFLLVPPRKGPKPEKLCSIT